MVKTDPNLIIPFAKPAGITSFSSLGQVKKLLATKKVGHTGTLDCFADGLLVLLSGKLTKLVPYITDCDKTYLVRFYFGQETDTLDPSGTVVMEKPLPRYAAFCAAVKKFTGTIQQTPPAYSAVKQGGERLSDKIRRGETVYIPPRTVTIYDIHIDEIFSKENFPSTEMSVITGAVLSVRCSKGTYIRSLVRDIAQCCGSAAYVYALRRTAVGPFSLDQAVGAAGLLPFEKESSAVLHSQITQEDITQKACPLSKTLAEYLGYSVLSLKKAFYNAFRNGKKIDPQWFSGSAFSADIQDGMLAAVFYDELCIGLIMKKESRYRYQAVFI